MTARIDQIADWVKTQILTIDPAPVCVIEPGENQEMIASRSVNIFMDAIAPPGSQTLGSYPSAEFVATISLEIETAQADGETRVSAVTDFAQEIADVLSAALETDPTGGGLFYRVSGGGVSFARDPTSGYGLFAALMTLQVSYQSNTEFM